MRLETEAQPSVRPRIRWRGWILDQARGAGGLCPSHSSGMSFPYAAVRCEAMVTADPEASAMQLNIHKNQRAGCRDLPCLTSSRMCQTVARIFLVFTCKSGDLFSRLHRFTIRGT